MKPRYRYNWKEKKCQRVWKWNTDTVVYTNMNPKTGMYNFYTIPGPDVWIVDDRESDNE